MENNNIKCTLTKENNTKSIICYKRQTILMSLEYYKLNWISHVKMANTVIQETPERITKDYSHHETLLLTWIQRKMELLISERKWERGNKKKGRKNKNTTYV